MLVVGLLAACRSSDSGTGPVDAIGVGQQLSASGTSDLTLQGGASGADYVLVAYNSSPNGDTFASASITGTGLATAPSASLMADRTSSSNLLTFQGGNPAGSPRLDEQFHIRLAQRVHAAGRKRMAAARAWFNARQVAAATTTRSGFRIAPSYSAIPATTAVGQVVTLNVNADSVCNDPIYHGFIVKAVGTKSIVLADTLNPAGGFTDADYQRFATRFDNLVWPLDTQNFGVPSDIDGNGRVAILFTRAVNELTPANSESFVGGFFFARDLFPATNSSATLEACPASNEGEMFYMLVPDPNGTINGNVQRVGFVDSLTIGVLAHEFQHLINASRRLYVNTAAIDFEEVVWLNEGLSHIAEELLYYQESGMSPRNNLSDADIRVNSRATYPFWKADASANFSRFIDYLQDPSGNSPAAGNDSLATRGATWSFLRYSVDQVSTDEAATWRAYDNSIDTGRKTINFALQTDPLPLFKSWALANYLDDTGYTTDPVYSHKSWNFRNIYSNTYVSLGGYPLTVNSLVDNTPSSARIRGLSAAYYRLSVPAGQSAHLGFSTTGTAGASLNFIAVRTR
jgi:hypothetical protein